MNGYRIECRRDRRSGKALLAGAIAGLALVATAGAASAQVNCNVLPHGSARANCYGQQAQIYRQQAQQYNAIAQRQWQQYQSAPRYIQPLRVIPGAGPLVGAATSAWRAPGYYYQYRYGRP